MTISYCVKCRKMSDSNNEKIITLSNGRKSLFSICNICGTKKYKFLQNNQKGDSVDIHKLIGKLPIKPGLLNPGKYKYMGPYNDLDNQLEYNSDGEITKFYQKPYNKVDEISAKHDVCYSIGKNKHECDRKMVNELDNLKYADMTKWGQLARFLIDKKEKLGMALN